MLVKKKLLLADAASERLANQIALRVIACKITIASKLNGRVNSYSKNAQKWLLVIACIIFLTCLLASFELASERTAEIWSTPAYQPTPFRMPPARQSAIFKPTDSLTNKKLALWKILSKQF